MTGRELSQELAALPMARWTRTTLSYVIEPSDTPLAELPENAEPPPAEAP